jgi:hypothetical protein
VKLKLTPYGTSTQPGSGGKDVNKVKLQPFLIDLGHKIKQSEMGAIFEKRNQEEEYSIEKCLDTVDAMEELTDEEKAITAEVFEKDMNRQMFMKQKNLNVRLIWLRRKIRYAYFHCHPLHSENKSEEAHVIFCYLGLALGLHQFEC